MCRNRRILWCWTFYVLLSTVLLGRLFLLMCIPDLWHPQWSQKTVTKAELEHIQTIRVTDGRGTIRFRNGEPWLAKTTADVNDESLRTVLPQAPWDAVVGLVGQPDVWPSRTRNVEEQGRYGLEQTFDRVLQSRRPDVIGVFADGHGEVDAAKRYELPAERGADIRTTIDLALQTASSHALHDNQVEQGAVVVLGVKDNQILVMADVDKKAPDSIVALKPETPGSVFKLVTAAAALESFQLRPDAIFQCKGFVHAPGVRMQCWATHGAETLLQALVVSCDVALAEVGMKIGRQAIQYEADRLHLLDTDLQAVRHFGVLPGAMGGIVFLRPGADNGLLANTAIGQEDVQISPLEAAELARTIASGGKWSPARLVLQAEGRGKTVRIYHQQATDKRVMSAATARTLQTAMAEAVKSPQGTAHALADADLPVAVKTGTAELGRNTNVNGWMIGFAPLKNPEIAFAVYVGNEPSRPVHVAVQQIVRTVLNSYRQIQAE